MNAEPAPDVHSSSYSYYPIAVAFVSGMTVMGVEMCASRLMAPFFGMSLSIWTAIIGSTMIALTAGYYLGGILAEKKPRMSFLGTLLFITGVFIVFLPYVTQPVMTIALERFAQQSPAGLLSTADRGSYRILTALMVSALLISAPVVVLGMTSPFIIRMDSLQSGSPEVGRISGKVFAFSTLGSILGTFLPALVLVPLVGVRFSFLLFGGALLGISLWSTKRARLLSAATALVVLALALMLGLQARGVRHGQHLVSEKETNYQLVQILRVPLDEDHRGVKSYETILMTDAGLGVQSLWTEGRPYTDSWQDFYSAVPRIYQACNKGNRPKRLLLLGLGGAVAPYMISRTYPDTIIDAVEIDSDLIEAAKPFFPFGRVERLTIHIADARFFLRTTAAKYDVIIIDVYRSAHIPFHVATAEFFAEVKNHLQENGILAMNVGCRGQKQVFKGIANTVASVFPSVYFAEYYLPPDKTVFDSRFLIAADRELNLEDPLTERWIFSVRDPEWRDTLRTMKSRRNPADLHTPYFKKVLYDPAQHVFLDDLSSMEIIAEREFGGLILGLGK